MPLERHGRQATVSALREVFDEMRARLDVRRPRTRVLAPRHCSGASSGEARAEPPQGGFSTSPAPCSTPISAHGPRPRSGGSRPLAASEPSTVEFDLESGNAATVNGASKSGYAA